MVYACGCGVWLGWRMLFVWVALNVVIFLVVRLGCLVDLGVVWWFLVLVGLVWLKLVGFCLGMVCFNDVVLCGMLISVWVLCLLCSCCS